VSFNARITGYAPGQWPALRERRAE
jgi:hypothetical protein